MTRREAMALHYPLGDRAGVVQAFKRCVARLRDEWARLRWRRRWRSACLFGASSPEDVLVLGQPAQPVVAAADLAGRPGQVTRLRPDAPVDRPAGGGAGGGGAADWVAAARVPEPVTLTGMAASARRGAGDGGGPHSA